MRRCTHWRQCPAWPHCRRCGQYVGWHSDHDADACYDPVSALAFDDEMWARLATERERHC